jgi:hypothetical protein
MPTKRHIISLSAADHFGDAFCGPSLPPSGSVQHVPTAPDVPRTANTLRWHCVADKIFLKDAWR